MIDWQMKIYATIYPTELEVGNFFQYNYGVLKSQRAQCHMLQCLLGGKKIREEEVGWHYLVS